MDLCYGSLFVVVVDKLVFFKMYYIPENQFNNFLRLVAGRGQSVAHFSFIAIGQFNYYFLYGVNFSFPFLKYCLITRTL